MLSPKTLNRLELRERHQPAFAAAVRELRRCLAENCNCEPMARDAVTLALEQYVHAAEPILSDRGLAPSG